LNPEGAASLPPAPHRSLGRPANQNRLPRAAATEDAVVWRRVADVCRFRDEGVMSIAPASAKRLCSWRSRIMRRRARTSENARGSWARRSTRRSACRAGRRPGESRDEVAGFPRGPTFASLLEETAGEPSCIETIFVRASPSLNSVNFQDDCCRKKAARAAQHRSARARQHWGCYGWTAFFVLSTFFCCSSR
jgi:hypothetical protein